MRLRVWKVKKSCVSSTTMAVGTRKNPTFSTTTTNINHILTTNKVVISLGTTSKATISLSKTLLLVSPTKGTSLLNNKLILLPLLLRKAALMFY
ncbi:hypothetical protein F2Q68_00003450 [Brassica cretica]|uniref:Uncharacterized protein n=1 Tax=Brassica cretica TaxID=69181 RepID=A0A8S9J988_BRACR|nr:hypothetical protein F2Q68_00003450 [Brassica cretica]